MKERLLSEGFKDIGGCSCSGGARFYKNESISPYIRIDDFYRARFLVLKIKGVKKETYQYDRIETLLEDIKKPI